MSIIDNITLHKNNFIPVGLPQTLMMVMPTTRLLPLVFVKASIETICASPGKTL